MTKQFLYIAGGLALFLVLTALILLMNLSTIGPYVVKKVSGGNVTVAEVDYGFDRGRITLKLSDLTIQGNFQGTVKRLDVLADLTSRPFLKSTVMTDFDLTTADMKGKTRFLPLPAEILEIRRGAITYNRQKIFIDELTIKNLKSGNPFLFNLAARNEAVFKTINVSGEGLYKGRSSELKGILHIAGLDLARLSSKLHGAVNIQGPFSYAKQSLAFEGTFDVSGFELQDRVLEKPVRLDRYSGTTQIAYANDTTDIRIDDIAFLNSSFSLSLIVDKKSLVSLDLTSGFIDVKEVKSYISLENIARGSGRLWDAIQEKGTVRIAKLHHEKRKPISADLELKDGGFTYMDRDISNINALLTIDSYKVTISEGRGDFMSSRITGAHGFISLDNDKQVRVKGSYSVSLQDIPSLLDAGTVKLNRGSTRGTMELDGNKSSGYRISGKGTVDDADVSWQTISASARGSYRFTNDEITFDPLVIRKGGTDMVIQGKWGKRSLGIFVKGSLDMDQVRDYTALPFPVKGIAFVDGEIRNDDNGVTVNGDVVMDEVSFVIPGFMKKNAGVRSAAHISASVRDKRVDIEHLSYNLDIIRLNGKGAFNPDRTINFDVAMNVTAIERVAPLFFLEKEGAKGDLDLDIAVRDLRLPLRRMPSIRGFVKINNGFVKLPRLPKPLKEINLNAEFKGNTSEILLERLVCGQTTVGKSSLRVEGLDSPRFSLSLAADTLDFADFKGGSEFTMSSIKQDSLLARAEGDLTLEVGALLAENITGEHLLATGTFRNRKLSVDRLTSNILGGYAECSGTVDLSNTIPGIGIQGKIRSMTGGNFLKAFGAGTSAIEGEGAVTGSLQFTGRKRMDFIESLRGNAAIYSKNGTIRKWNLLAKVFSLLNLYDLFRGKIQFTEAGLQYRKMGATFRIKDGVFATENFVLDSPSMLITGKGSLDGKSKEINGTITVSPLVTIDKTINKIPILRSIVKNKDKGFIYASYDVKGNIEDPAISLNYVQTIGGRTVDTLKNVLTLPVDLFERK